MSAELLPVVGLVLFALLGILIILRPRTTVLMRRHTASSRNGHHRHFG